jgi:hypothetical protein
MLNWLVEEKGIAPHIPAIDKSKREDGTFSRSDFRYDPTVDVYHCPAGKQLGTSGTVHEGKTLLYRASKLNCMHETLPDRSLAQWASSSRDVSIKRSRCGSPI